MIQLDNNKLVCLEELLKASSNSCQQLFLQNLKLHNFRNFKYQNFSFSNNFIFVIGQNGLGKTNLLEAISLSFPGRGLRGAANNEMSRISAEGTKNWQVNYQLTSNMGLIDIKASLQNSKKLIEIDDNKTSTAELAKINSIIWLTPQMNQLFIGGATERRRFFDRYVYNFDAAHAERINKYETLIKERINLLLNHSDTRWLNIVEQNIAEISASIAFARNHTISYINQAMQYIDDLFPKAIISFIGEIEEMATHSSSIELELYVKQKLVENRELDRLSKKTNFGVHKTDIKVVHAAKNTAAKFCSTGEQKILLISIIISEILAKIKWQNIKPILLLDEIAVHLDDYHQALLFKLLNLLNCQTFITSTEEFNCKNFDNFQQITFNN